MQCCLGVNKGDNDPPYTKVDHEGSSLLHGSSVSGSKYSSVEEFLGHHKSIHNEEANLWTNPDDHSHSVEEDDHALITLIQESQSCKNSQKKDQLNKAIKKIRDERKATQTRWKHIMIGLGFDREADKLLDVHTTAQSGDPSSIKTNNATDMHRRLVEESNIFGHSSTQAVRYIVVLDRLLDLDIADSFLVTAINKYPKALES